MLDRNLIYYIKKIFYLFVLYGFSFLLIAQEELPTFDEPVEQSPESGQTPEETTTAEAPEESPGNQPEAADTGNDNRDFDVFRPSEEISEDLAVPFPADI